mgnify:FL=1|jgi:hypothetical protein
MVDVCLWVLMDEKRKQSLGSRRVSFPRVEAGFLWVTAGLEIAEESATRVAEMATDGDVLLGI